MSVVQVVKTFILGIVNLHILHNLPWTGLAQCSELCWQLRGMANKRQVDGAKVALQHNVGLGGAAVVAMYRLGFPQKAV